ncbi:Telomerase reverse transcriptase [Nosema granulosis]|uniref:Telomerase reverse transcriptase n=1 Tax=Nosema granulosis TaxID=83296 RepID=A0A9P6GYW2_9MICR|nr:Telomerase reverse transcriptase [Nosema granulosis]
MPEILKKLGFIKIEDYLSLYDISIRMKDVFIKFNTILDNPDFNNRHSFEEVLQHAIKLAIQRNPHNAIAAGYQKGTRLICNTPNSTLNLIKTKEWDDVLKATGDELFIHILTHCCVVQIVNNNKILLAGNLKDCINRKSKQRVISRNRIFFKDKTVLKFVSSEFISKVVDEDTSLNEEKVFKKAIQRVEEKYKKTKIGLIFKSKFKHNENNTNSMISSEIEHRKVVDFLFCISKKIFKDVFSYFNFRILKQKLTLFVFRNRFETLSEEELIRHFKIKQFPWSKENHAHALTKRTIFQLFEDFFIPLVSSFFYSTESCYGKLKVFYYSRVCWYKFANLQINSFIENMCDTNNYEVVKDSKSHNLRCIPKKEGGRVVVNLSKKSYGVTPNRQMYPQYTILKGEMRNKLGNSALGYEDMYKKVYPFINSLDKAYILKLDLKKCFDNIPHKYLQRVIDQLYEKDYYCVKKFTTLGFECSTLKLGKFYKVLTSNLPSDTLYTETVFPSQFIYKDEVYMNSLSKEDVRRSIHKMVFENKIVYRNNIYTQTRGIPQGSVFSTMLCSIYLNQIDVKFFDRVVKKGRIVRFVDDYLIITPSYTEINILMNLINKLKPLGLEFSTEKIESNFKDGSVFDSEIIWCGMKIISKAVGGGTRTGIKMNLKEKLDKYGVSFPSLSPGSTISNRMKIFFKSRTPEILFCPENQMVYQNIFDFFLLYKIRLKTLFSRAPFVNRTFYSKILQYSVDQMVELCRRRKIKASKKLIVNISKTAFDSKANK